MSTEFQYDVFLSHNSADKPRVQRLEERLQAAGRRQSDFGFRISDFGFPPQAAGVGLERSTGLFRDPANAGRRFIPLHQGRDELQTKSSSLSWNWAGIRYSSTVLDY